MTIFVSCHFCFPQKIAAVDSMVIKKVDSLALLGKRLWNTDLDASEAVAKYMLEFSEKHNYLKGKGQAFNNFAVVYNNRGYEGKSLEYYKKSIDVFKELKMHSILSRIRYNIGVAFLDTKQYEVALEYLEKSEDYSKEVNDTLNLAMVNLAIGYVYLGINKSLVEVLSKMKKAEVYSRAVKDTINICASLNGQSESYLQKDKNIDIVIKSSKEATRLMKISNSENHFILGYSYLMLSKGYRKEKKFEKALLYNDSSLVAYKALEYSAGLNLTYETRKKILVNMGNYEEAFKILELLSASKDTSNKEDREKKFSRMKVELETDRIAADKDAAEARAALAEATGVQNRNYLISAITIAILIALSSLFYFRKLKTAKQAELVATELMQTQKRLVLEKKYKESELKALKSQMNPHFIFNTLNSIQEYIVTNKKNEASEYLGRFADLIRRYLKHSETGSISIADEVESLEIYLDLEGLRFEDDFNYHITLAQALTDVTLRIPTMMVQPYVENAIRHGLLHKKGKRKLVVSFTKGKEGTINCIVEDNGIGRKKGVMLSKKLRNKHESFAEKATQERLSLFNDSATKKIGVETIDLYEGEKPIGTKIILNIPIIS